MSANACIAYFGLLYDVSPREIENLEQRSDARQIAARAAGLTSYWGNFGGEADRYLLLVGTKIAVLGVENDLSSTTQSGHLEHIISDTTDRLQNAGLSGDIALHLAWLSDVGP